jgi:hypothetical protein
MRCPNCGSWKIYSDNDGYTILLGSYILEPVSKFYFDDGHAPREFIYCGDCGKDLMLSTKTDKFGQPELFVMTENQKKRYYENKEVK